MKPFPPVTLRPSWLLLLLLVASCQKHDNNPGGSPRPTAPHVYVLGTVVNTLLYWKDGSPVKLDSQIRIEYQTTSSDIIASHNNVYIGGVTPGFNNSFVAGVPTYWLNGWANILPDSSGDAFANSVAVAGSDVYTAGITYYTDTSHVLYTTHDADYPKGGMRATIWKNGMPLSLPGYYVVGIVHGKYGVRGYEDYVSGISISGTDVYVAGGSLWTPAHAGYWKNGVPVDLNSGLVYEASNGKWGFPTTTSIYAAGSDVYVTGFQTTSGLNLSTLAIYWHNGTLHFLSTDSVGGSDANSVFVAGNDVYVAGYQNINNYWQATLWKNGVATTLTSGPTASVATSVFVWGHDVYVAGYQWTVGGHYTAVYWKNGSVVRLTDGGENAIAYAIFVG